MKRRYLAGDQVCRGNLILVNKKHPLQSPEPADRVIFPGSGEELKAEAEQALERLVKAAEGEGELLLQSGYRTEKMCIRDRPWYGGGCRAEMFWNRKPLRRFLNKIREFWNWIIMYSSRW